MTETANNSALVPMTSLLRQQLEEYLEKQWAMSWMEQRSLINSTVSLNEAGVRKALTISKTYKLPLDVIAMIPTKQGLKPYIMARGIIFRLQTDPRGLKGISTEVLQWPTPDNLETETNTAATLDTIVMKCETKAVRRAGIMATGIPFPLYEEEMEWQAQVAHKAMERATVEGEVRELDESTSNNAAELLALAFAAGMSLDEVLEKLNLSDVSELGTVSDFDEALEALGLKVE